MFNPVLVELGAQRRAVAMTVTLSNKALGPMRLQAELLRWGQDLQGQAVTEPTDDLLVTPPIADLSPGGEQVFRVALRAGRPAPEELAYRLILEDVAEPTDGIAIASGASIHFRMRYDLPVLVAPAQPVVNVLRWRPCSPEASSALVGLGAEACVRLFNAGNRRVKVQTLMVAGDGWQQALSLTTGENVLAGAEREWRVPLAQGQAGALRSVQVQTARGETLRAEAGNF